VSQRATLLHPQLIENKQKLRQRSVTKFEVVAPPSWRRFSGVAANFKNASRMLALQRKV
jgi:hypothetical protein